MAWHPLGWTPAFFSEIEAFPSAVLAHHYGSNMPSEPLAKNGIPNLGDMTKFEEWPDYAIDLLVGGTPCQSFSVAGLRQGLADPRGNLMLTYLAIARRYQPRWLVWENVPGVFSSNGGRDFGTFIRGLEECGYHAAWRVLDAQFTRVDGFPHAVPQRRRRVFVVGYLGDWRRAAAVLFERESLRGDPYPRRQAGKGASSATGRGPGFAIQAGALRENPKSGPDGVGVQADVAYTIEARTEVQAIAFDLRGREDGAQFEGPHPRANIRAGSGGSSRSYIAQEVRPINTMVGLRHNALGEGTGLGIGSVDDPAFTLSKAHSHAVQDGWIIRRLTPTECERLQGFPDNFTNVPWGKKDTSPDGPRYKALGNSMACNVMRWIGRRIEMVEKITKEDAA
ncbi:MAG: DNA cytosine methyltransferase [Agrobacterium cavarae]